MNLLLNGTPITSEANALDTVLAENGYAEATVATAVNGNFVPVTLRATHTLTDGDQIEVLAPMQGG
ncbi:sulfur carrier protein ThiS [Cognatiyoonia sp.]|uniref:sulfur carrier protein ThiS n=1 Tax=Cognatiyoonia sp. TaxID=2211652 RepID=UPI003F69E09B